MTPYAEFEPNVFTCTFCYRLSTQKPHILGRSARLTCAECYTVIIDLSICWACGELVLREADSVSFGWCFWHRACYGCLLYGSPKLRLGALDSRKAEASTTEEDAGQGPRRRGEESLQAPLCALCAADCDADSLDEHGVLERGLKRIDLVDGGVTRRRWIEKSRRQTAGMKRWSSNARDKQPGHGHQEGQQKNGNQSVPMFWVNMNDPINGPSFRPSPSKPLPPHMQHVFEYDGLTTTSGLPMRKRAISRWVDRAERAKSIRVMRHSKRGEVKPSRKPESMNRKQARRS
ncbi:hypothetical protein E4U54_000888 [Claviceps lovelessii]|nr:hypothetical protein E4U54_000888 [Claviceps lovelessii]